MTNPAGAPASALVEKVARAMCAAHGDNPDRLEQHIAFAGSGQPAWRKYVRTADAAISIVVEKYLEVTPEMIDAGVRVLTTEFGAPTENPLTNFPAVARETFLEMLAASFAGSSHSESK